jgi:hypothetical protein
VLRGGVAGSHGGKPLGGCYGRYRKRDSVIRGHVIQE